MIDYLPKDEQQLRDWAGSFVVALASSAGKHGISAEALASLNAAVQSYVEALAVARAPATRTAANIAIKNAAKKQMLQRLRPAAQQIRANRSVPESLKVQLGIKQAGAAPARPADLSSGPQLRLERVEPLRHVLAYGERKRLGRAKPRGAIGLQVFMYIGENPPADPLDARFLRFLSRPRYAVDFKPEQVGQSVYYYARWQSATGETSPWGNTLRMIVAG